MWGRGAHGLGGAEVGGITGVEGGTKLFVGSLVGRDRFGCEDVAAANDTAVVGLMGEEGVDGIQAGYSQELEGEREF
jgi:hypothetical protein